MASLERLTGLIDTLESLNSIVTIMKTLAAVTIKQLEARQFGLNDAARVNALGLKVALNALPEAWPPPTPRPISSAVIIIGSERGFCGHFNERVVQHLIEASSHDPKSSHAKRLILGTRLASRFEENGLAFEQSLSLPSTPEGLEGTLTQLLEQIEAWHQAETTQITLIATRQTQQNELGIVEQCIWPTPIVKLQDAQRQPWPSRRRPQVLGDAFHTVRFALRQMLKTDLLEACLTSMISENTARLASLQVAEDNLGKKLVGLSQTRNAHRQRAITEELLDISSGFNLSSERLENFRSRNRLPP